MRRVIQILVLALLFFVVGCKTTKNVASTGEVNKKLSSKQIIKEHAKNETDFKTLQSRVKVEYIQGEMEQSHSINLRMEKDKTIWLSATLGIVRAKITPEKVSFYNKLDNTYFDGDFSLISDLLGTDVDYEKIQNLLLGEALFDLESGNYKSNVHEKSYLLQPKRQSALMEIFLLLNPSHFKMGSQQIAQEFSNRFLQVDYKGYQEVDKQIIPEKVSVVALEGDYETVINMEFKSVSLDEDLRFPFRIPSGFEEIVIK